MVRTNRTPYLTRAIMAFYIAVDLAEPGISPNLWVVSPFFEPMKFAPTLTGTSYQPAKVDLAALAKEIPPRPLPVSPTSRGYQVGPFPTYGSFSRESYSWVSETGLALHPGRDLAGLVDLPRAQGFPLNEVSRHSMGVSPDNSRVAYTQNGYLVVRDVPSGEEKKWALTKTPDSDIEISVGLIEPDGSIRILFPAPKGEAFVPSILQSPSGRYLAIPRERPDTDGPRWIIIEVLDLAG